MREHLRKTKTDVAAFPHGYPRDMKHVSLSILYILQSPDAGQSMEDVCSHSSLLAQVTRSLVMTWVTADSPGLLPSCGRRTLFRWSQKKTIGQLLLWPTFNWVDTLKTTKVITLTKVMRYNRPMGWPQKSLPHPVWIHAPDMVTHSECTQALQNTYSIHGTSY